ncbi:MAG: FGGY family carbohydrate kinase, partial [Promethearchaeota archaeon]
MKVIGAIDQGTTGTRFILFDQSGSIFDSAYQEHQQIYPKPGYVEHDPIEIWQNTKKVMKKVLDEHSDQIEEVVGLGVTNQRETTVIWDKNTGKPLHNALVWQDTRTDDLCKELSREGYDELFTQKTGLRIATYFSGPKIKWLIENVPKIKNKAKNGEA